MILPDILWKSSGKPVASDETRREAATNRLSGEMRIGGQEHFYLEGQAALALPQEGGDMIVHSSSQHPTEIQHKVAEALE